MKGQTVIRRFTDEMARRLKPVSLDDGGHDAPAVRQKFVKLDEFAAENRGVCVMEAVAYITGQPHTDHPICVSAVITSFLMDVNDSTDDAKARNALKRVIPKIIGTRPLVRYRDRSGNPMERAVKVGEHKGYDHAEDRRQRLLKKALTVRVVDELADEEYEETREVSDVPVKEAIAIVEKLAAIPNRAPARKEGKRAHGRKRR